MDRQTIIDNTKAKKIPIGKKISSQLDAKCAVKKVTKPIEKCFSEKDNLSVPSVHTTAKIKQFLVKLKEEDLNVDKLVDNKLQSPNTNKLIKKKVSEKLSVAKNRQVYRDLVSTCIQKEDIVSGAEEQLKLRANSVRPLVKGADKEPSLEYFDSLKYIYRANLSLEWSFTPMQLSPEPFSREKLTKLLR